MIMTTAIRIAFAALLFAGFTVVSIPAHAQLLEVEQTVFGMDCAPCAYGLEKRLKKIEGTTKARVSLNEGLATIDLAEQNAVKLSTIREAIRESGFSAEASTIRVTGTLKQEAGRWAFDVETGERFVLEKAAQGEPAYRNLKPGRATITGLVPKGEVDERGTYRLQVLSVSL